MNECELVKKILNHMNAEDYKILINKVWFRGFWVPGIANQRSDKKWRPKVEFINNDVVLSELPLPCGTVVPMEVASNSRDSYPFLTKRLAVRTNQGIFTYAAIPLTGIPFGFSLWNPYTSGAERNV